MMQTPSTPRSRAPPVLFGSSGAVERQEVRQQHVGGGLGLVGGAEHLEQGR